MIESVLKLPGSRSTDLKRNVAYQHSYALKKFSLLGFDTGYFSFVAIARHGVAIEKIAVNIANARVEIAWPKNLPLFVSVVCFEFAQVSASSQVELGLHGHKKLPHVARPSSRDQGRCNIGAKNW